MAGLLRRLTLLALVVCLGIAGCTVESERGQQRKPLVVATILPLQWLLADIAGDDAEVAVLLKPGASPHTYEPRPTDAAMLERAVLLVSVGPSLDGWVASFPVKRHAILMEMLQDATLIEDNHAHHDHAHHDHEHHGANPHVWLDPVLMNSIVPALVEELCAAIPESCEQFRARGAGLQEALAKLDAETHAQLAPVSGGRVVSFHPSFTYFLHRYGLEDFAVVISTPGKEPSPKFLGELVAKLKQAEIRAIFTEPQLDPRPAEVIAEAAGLRVFLLDPIGGAEGRTTYEELIRYNARTILEALR